MKKTAYIALTVLLFSISAFYCIKYFGGYEGIGDGNDYAGLARNLISGRGFILGHVYPLSLVYNENLPQPNNIWAPGYPVYLAFWFSFCGANDQAAIWGSIFAVYLLALAGYFIGRRLGGSLTGLLTLAFICLNQTVLYSAIEGTPEILAGAILTFSILMLLGEKGPARIIISGILFALAILIRYQLAIIAIPFWIIFLKGSGRLFWIWVLTAFIILLPWGIRNWIVLGNPIFTLQSYGEFTKGMGRFDDFYFTYRSFAPMSFFYTISHFPFDLTKKFIAGLIFFAGAFPLRLNYLGIVPFFFGIMKLYLTDSPQRKIAMFAFISAVLVIVISSFDGHHDRHFIPLEAFLVVTMFIGLEIMGREFGFAKYKIVMVVAGAILFLPTRAPFIEHRLSSIADICRNLRPAFSQISEIVAPGEVILSDASDAVWWYANRSSIWIPVHMDDIKTAISRGKCRYLYLADPVAFINKLNDQDLAEFAYLVIDITSFDGPGKLYKIVQGDKAPLSLAGI
jgi:hypothetical protein